MQQILVTTDLSANSKAGIHFAIHLAKQTGANLIFIHIYQVLRATTWSDDQYQHFIERNREGLSEDLSAFVAAEYESLGETPGNYQTIVHHNLDTVAGIIQSAEKYQCNYICISTRGAGILKKLFGTNTGKLIISSGIPVLCIPSAWQPSPVTRILYASDMRNYEEELRHVVAFAKPAAATVEMLHLYLHPELAADKEKEAQKIAQTTDYDVTLHYEQRNIDRSIIEEIDIAIQKYNPNLLAMFTNQDRTFFERLFLSSSTEAYSFRTQVPMLTFNK